MEGRGEGRRAPSREAANKGAGTPRNAGKGEGWLADLLERAKGEESDGRLTRLNVDIDEDLHIRLKTHCLKNRVKLRQLVPALLEAYLEQAGE